MSQNLPLRILVYQDMWGDFPKTAPGNHELFFDRSRWEEADAIVFHMPQLGESGFPPEKLKGQSWVAWSMESEANYPILNRRCEVGSMFDIWMTYQQSSDVWYPYISTNMIDTLKVTPVEKTASSPAVALISSRFDQSRRLAFLEALMQKMPIDSYGKTLCNQGTQIGPGQKLKNNLVSKYKFTLAFENSICEDYVTEKFFDPLLVGSVPVYLGAPNIEEYAPGENCYIDVTQFDSPGALAKFLVDLAADDEAYAGYLRWKSQPLYSRFIAMVERTRRDPFERLADLLQRIRAEGGIPLG